MTKLNHKTVILIFAISFFSKLSIQAEDNPNITSNQDQLENYKNKKKNIVFDPTTKKWVEVVNIDSLEKSAMAQIEWTYNPIAKKWEQVNINNITTNNSDLYEGNFWNDFGVLLSIGLGGSYQKNSLYGLSISQYDDYLILQNSQDLKNQRGYKINWLTDNYELVQNLIDNKINKTFNKKDAKGSYFFNYNFNWHFGLAVDYNFLEHFSVEFGVLCDAMSIDILQPSNDLSEKYSSMDDISKDRYFIWNKSINICVGYIFAETEYSDFIVKIGGGPSFFAGSDLFDFSGAILGWNIKPSLAWSYHVNGYFTFIPELYYSYAHFKDSPEESFWKDSSYVSMSNHQLGIDLKFRVNFAENVEFS